MRRLGYILPLLLIALPTSTAPTVAQETPESLYQAALYQEEVAGDLAAAIGLYERILEVPESTPVTSSSAPTARERR